jgi:hypothetical protein
MEVDVMGNPKKTIFRYEYGSMDRIMELVIFHSEIVYKNLNVTIIPKSTDVEQLVRKTLPSDIINSESLFALKFGNAPIPNTSSPYSIPSIRGDEIIKEVFSKLDQFPQVAAFYIAVNAPENYSSGNGWQIWTFKAED